MRLVDRKLHAKFHQNRTIFDGVTAKKRKIKIQKVQQKLNFIFSFFGHNSLKNGPILMKFCMQLPIDQAHRPKSQKFF